ncbi:hypothetical protein CRX72_13615 [Pantoea sp. BRM17]|nr:hypothetical protein CRX72_13615 [Pantoea sp. BRM17]
MIERGKFRSLTLINWNGFFARTFKSALNRFRSRSHPPAGEDARLTEPSAPPGNGVVYG